MIYLSKISLCLLWLLTLATPPLKAQNPTVQFGKVPIEDLQMQVYTSDSSAIAVVLYEKGQSYYIGDYQGFKLIHERHLRVKILSRAAYLWSKFEIPLSKPKGLQEKEELISIEGYTHLLKEGKIVRHKLESQDLFVAKPHQDWEVIRFAMPYCEVGAVVEYKYKTSSDFIFNLPSWDFQKSIPTVWSEYDVKVPEFLVFKEQRQGYEPFIIDNKKQLQDYFGLGGTLVTADIQQLTYAQANLPAFTPLSFMEYPSHYSSRIEFILDSFRFPSMRGVEKIPSDWATVHKALLKEDKVKDFLKRSGDTKDFVNQLVANQMTPYDKMKTIFEYVKKNIVYTNEPSRLPTAKNADKVFADKKGNLADINLLLVALLRNVGLVATPVVLASKETGKAYPETPNINKLNSLVVAVWAANQFYFLDATEEFAAPNLLNLRFLNGKGLLLSDTLQTVLLFPKEPSSKNITIDAELKSTGEIVGKGSVEEKGYIAYKSRNTIKHISPEAFIQQSFSAEGEGMGMENLVIQNQDNPYLPLQATMQFMTTLQSQVKGQTIQVAPLLSMTEKVNPFVMPNRKYPVDFVFPFEENYTLNLTIPKDYKVTMMPQNVNLSMPNEAIVMSFVTMQEGSLVRIKHRLVVNKSTLLPQEYGALRDFWDKIIQQHQNSVIISK